jgi:hypothetical protein
MAKNKIVYASYIFSDDDETLRSGNEYQITSLIADELQADTIELEVKCSDKNIVVFTENAPLQYYRENLLRSTYYVQSIKRIGGDKYTISADSAMGLLMKRLHVGGIYTGQTVKEVVNEICGNIPILVKTVFADTKLYGWLPYCKPPESSARNNLAQVLYAIGAALTTDNNGVLRVEPLWDGVSSSIGETRMYFDGSVETEKPISAVTVTEHQYIAGTNEKELFSGTSQQGDIITFSEPMHSLTATGFTILESGANYAKISSGSGSLKGKTYIHNTRLVTQTVTENAAENVKSVTDATLVSLVNSSAVAKRLADYYKCRETITNGIVSGQEKPGHVVSVYHPYDKKMVSACIVSLDTTMSGTLKSEMTALVGFLPPQPETTEYYDGRVLLTGSGEWTVPEGVTELRAVVIGKGQDGTDGSNGYASIMTSQMKDGSSGSFSAASPGLGGDGGVGGSGGKILEETINVTAGQKIQYAAADNSGDSTFGSLSSADGTSSDTGYYDTVTQTYFGRKGADGKKGGNGGSPGNDGQAVGNFRGGYGLSGKTDTDTSYGITGQGSISGWGGGGAAHGSFGGQSGGGFWINLTGQFNQTDPSQSIVTLEAGYSSGGRGANGANGKDGENYGDGGGGGHGGGGAGAIGTINLSFSPSGKNPRVYSGSGAWGDGGSAGTGGSGKPGCIILYYRKFGQVRSWPFVQRGGGLFFDRRNKLFIV